MADHKKERGAALKIGIEDIRIFYLCCWCFWHFCLCPCIGLPACSGAAWNLFSGDRGHKGAFPLAPGVADPWGDKAQACCKLYIFLVNLGGCWPRPIYCYARVARNCYAGLAASFCYCFSVYYVYIYMVRGLWGR